MIKSNRLTDIGFIIFIWCALIAVQYIFVRQLIPPQAGWWQYYAWQINEGKDLYKDIYCYLPPYYVWLVALIYPWIKMNMMGYYIIGIFINCVTVTLLYKFFKSYLSPLWSAIVVMGGAILQISFLMYIPFDYNQVITSIVICFVICIIKGINTGNSRYYLLSGLFVGLFIMSKQTGLIYFVGTLFVLIPLVFRINVIRLRSLATYCVGCLGIIVPGLVYLIATDSFYFFLQYVGDAGVAKGPLLGIIYRTYKAGFSVSEFIISSMILFYLTFHDFEFSKTLSEKNVRTFFWNGYSYILFLIIANKLFHNSPVHTFFVANLVYWICWLYYRHGCMNLPISFKNINKYLTNPWSISLIFLIFLLLVYNIGFTARAHFYNTANLFMKKRFIVDICFGVTFLYSIYEYYYVVRYKRTRFDLNLAVFSLLFSGYIAIGLLASIVEEVYIMPVYIVWATLLLIKAQTYNNRNYCLVKIMVIMLALFITFATITQKQIEPYSWHGWSTVGSNIPGKSYRSVNIPGLGGFEIDSETADAYERINYLIQTYTTEEDKVFNFPHIPLFNNLNYRANIGKVPVLYFDVCPDDIAIQELKQIKTTPPKMIIWNDFGEKSWTFHENYFRNGQLSGQRKVIDWYKEYVPLHYKLLYNYKKIYIWVKDTSEIKSDL